MAQLVLALVSCSGGGSGSSGGSAPPPPPSNNGFAGTLTYKNDNARTGQNRNETVLTPANVNSTRFGKLFSFAVDGYAYAQPLYVPSVQIPDKGAHNIVYVATEHNSVYAFDADNRSSAPLWQVNLGPAVPFADVLNDDIVPEIGITGTPVIDAQSNTLYVVAKTKESGGYFQRLHALDIATGAEKFGGPVEIKASVLGTGDGGDGTTVPFNALRENQRMALLLANGIAYIAFASHGDNDPYHGWVLGYSASTLQQAAVFNDTPDGDRGGIWQSAAGPSADASGNIYVISGNGAFDADSGGRDFGDTFLKLSAGAGGLTVLDSFTPFDQMFFSNNDLDVGSTGALLLPDQTSAHAHLLIGGSKKGLLYLVDRDNMGRFDPNTDRVVQTVSVVTNPNDITQGIFSTPAFWENHVYVLAVRDALKSFSFNGSLLSTLPTSQASDTFAFPGGQTTISSNGSTNGIVWVLDVSGFRISDPAILFAHDATDVSRLLYRSDQAANFRDQAGPAVKFTVPTVANGKVYVGTQTELSVYGLLP